jgi:hypothetical protein
LAGANIFFIPTRTFLPAAFAARCMLSISTQDAAGGFSIHTWRPALRQSTAMRGYCGRPFPS